MEYTLNKHLEKLWRSESSSEEVPFVLGRDLVDSLICLGSVG